jgi:hypothetical protein
MAEVKRPETSLQRNARYRRVEDRAPLEVLVSGLIVVRCIKHEPIATGKVPRATLRTMTDKLRGSKFAREWSLVPYVDWLTNMIQSLGWDHRTGHASHEVEFPSPVGVSNGKPVYRIRIVSDGRYVHSYPVE